MNMEPKGIPIASIVATTLTGGIGIRNRLPWNIREDLKYFEKVTKGTCNSGLVLGRKCFESLPSRPLSERTSCVVTRSQILSDLINNTAAPKLYTARTIHDACDTLKRTAHCNKIFITGGSGIYDEAHNRNMPHVIYWNRVCGRKIQTDTSIDLDAMLAGYDIKSISKTRSDGKHTYDFCILESKRHSDGPELVAKLAEEAVKESAAIQKEFDLERNLSTAYDASYRSTQFCNPGHDEYQYLKVLENIIRTGNVMDDRTGVGTLNKWGACMRFDLAQSFPLLTTKRVYWKGVVQELLWFLKGDTNANHLRDNDVHIWDGNGSREFLDSRGLEHREVGDLGPVYGFQWRHFGAPYGKWNDDYKGKGVDQIADLIHMIKTEPTSRRLLFSAWNPAALKDMALPPCHVLCQFLVDPIKKELSCLMFQRSADWGLGIPFNIASYSLLTLLIAQVCDLKPKEFVHFVGNAHVYKNHIEPLKEQLKRIPRPFPLVKIEKSITSIDDFKASDIKLIGYDPYPALRMEMAV